MSEQLPMVLAALWTPDLPPKVDYGIAFAGCGGVVNYGHVPSYRACGFTLVGCYDVNRAAAEETARTHGIPKVYAALDDLLADAEVAIVDIAVAPWVQREIVPQVINARRHLLCQKPLAERYADAEAIVGLARAGGVKLAVNQQFRWSPLIRALRAVQQQEWLGKILDVQVQVSIHTPWELWPWIAARPRLEVLYHSIHYLDTLRFLFGDPALVTSHHTRHPDQTIQGETKTVTVWEYPSGLQILVAVCHYDRTPGVYSTLRVLGTMGVFEGTIGTNYNYPHGRNDTAKFFSLADPLRNFDVTLPGKWIPDAFYGPMASLMEAIQTGGEPVTSGEDTLGTLRVVEAAYRSAAERRSVSPQEIAA